MSGKLAAGLLSRQTIGAGETHKRGPVRPRARHRDTIKSSSSWNEGVAVKKRTQQRYVLFYSRKSAEERGRAPAESGNSSNKTSV